MDWNEATRRAEIKNQRWGIGIGALTLVAALLTAIAAVLAAKAATEAVSTAQDAVLRASREQRLSSGIESMGGDTSAQRIAGIGLLTRSVANEMRRVEGTKESADDEDWERDRREVNASYIATMNALENYIGSWRGPAGDAGAVAPPPVGSHRRPTRSWGTSSRRTSSTPPTRSASLTGEDVEKSAESLDLTPSIDLSAAPLSGLPLTGLDVSWLGTFYAPDIDLRQASLANTTWGKAAKLMGGHLQCARLNDADLSGANLQDADLRGADLTGADLEDTIVTGAKLRGAVLSPEQLEEAEGGDHVGGADASGRGAGPGLHGALRRDRPLTLRRGRRTWSRHRG